MCESAAYLKRGDREELVLAEVSHLGIDGENLVLTGILGNKVTIRAEILELDLMLHKLLLKERL